MKLARVLLSGVLVTLGAACTITSTDPAPSGSGSGSGTGSGTDTSPPGSSGGPTTPTRPPGGGETTPGGATVSENEPVNDTFAGAEIVKLDDTVKATFSKKDDEDFYSITMPAGAQDGVLTITINETSNDVRPQMDLFTKGQTKLKSFYAADTTTNPVVFSWDASAGTTYIVMVTDYGRSPDITPYTMKASFTPVLDTSEPNTTFADAKAAALNTPFDLFLFAGDQTNKGDDEDYYSVNVPASAGKLSVKIKNNSTNEAPQRFEVDLYDGTKAHKATAYGANEQADLDHLFDVPAGGGTLYLKFSDYSRNNSTVASKVTITTE